MRRLSAELAHPGVGRDVELRVPEGWQLVLECEWQLVLESEWQLVLESEWQGGGGVHARAWQRNEAPRREESPQGATRHGHRPRFEPGVGLTRQRELSGETLQQRGGGYSLDATDATATATAGAAGAGAAPGSVQAWKDPAPLRGVGVGRGGGARAPDPPQKKVGQRGVARNLRGGEQRG